jgi:ribose-phosphate pyrophosphokinase
MSNYAIFAGNSNPCLAQSVADYLDVSLGKALVNTFSDGEIQVEIKENVRLKDVFILQSTSPPVNDHLVELLLMIDAVKRSSARSITAVIPYYGYARQDKKVVPRVPISAKLIADLLTTAGVTRVITIDLHAGQLQGFFNIPVDNLYAAPAILKYISRNFAEKHHTSNDNIVIVSPDAGGVERARAFAKRLGAGLAIIDKRREKPNEAQAMAVIGNVKNKVAIILDDMVDTAGTLTEAAGAIQNEGAVSVHACCSHAVLSGPAVDRIEKSALESLVVTDTVPLRDKASQCGKIKILSIAELVGEAIVRSYRGDSVNSLFV